jgi:hypothetical protein
VETASGLEIVRNALQGREALREPFGPTVVERADEVESIVTDTALLRLVNEPGQLFGLVGQLKDYRKAEVPQRVRRVELHDPAVSLVGRIGPQQVEALACEREHQFQVR